MSYSFSWKPQKENHKVLLCIFTDSVGKQTVVGGICTVTDSDKPHQKVSLFRCDPLGKNMTHAGYEQSLEMAKSKIEHRWLLKYHRQYHGLPKV